VLEVHHTTRYRRIGVQPLLPARDCDAYANLPATLCDLVRPRESVVSGDSNTAPLPQLGRGDMMRWLDSEWTVVNLQARL
jgi:hypothetical protein